MPSPESLPPSVNEIADLIIRSRGDAEISRAVALNEARKLQKNWSRWKMRDFSKLPSPRRAVINATGVLLHTNLGRAPLGPQLFDRLKKTLSGYANLEMILSTGERGGRTAYLDALFATLVKNYKPVWVNNNAAAVLLVLNTLKKETGLSRLVISRGELVEIGGGFRVPEIMTEGGFDLVEVGTTNKTRLADYERALTKGPAVVCAVHPSNFIIKGFAESVKPDDLIDLCRRRKSPLIYDAGTLSAEELSRIKSGFDAVTVSTDKTLGSVQGGIVMANPALHSALLQNPFYRALRLDKISLTALEFAFEALAGKTDRQILPLSKMLHTSLDDLKALGALLKSREFGTFRLNEVACDATLGGGALPGETFPSLGLEILPLKKIPNGAASVIDALRRGSPAVLASIINGSAVLNLKTIMDFQIQDLLEALQGLDVHLSRGTGRS